MPIASLTQAALSAAAVGTLLWMLRRAGPRAAGLTAAVPINSLPALFWLSQQQGPAFAASAVLGSLGGTALTVALGASVVRITRPRRAAAPGPRANPDGEAIRSPARSDAILMAMATAGAMSLGVSELSRHAGPQLCGLVAAVPVVGMFATWAGWRQGGAVRMLQVVGGYLDGMAAKAAFLAALGAAWTLGAGGWAWPLGAATAALVLRARRQPRRPRPAASRPVSPPPPASSSGACDESDPCLPRRSRRCLDRGRLARRRRGRRRAGAAPPRRRGAADGCAAVLRRQRLTGAPSGGDPTAAAALQALFLEVLDATPDVMRQIEDDLLTVVRRDPACRSPLHALLDLKGLHALQTHRIAHRLWQRERFAIAHRLASLASASLGVDIHPAVPIGRGVLLDHATGIVIGETARVEDDVTILQGVTLGATGKQRGDRHPKVRAGALLGAGALVLGNIEIGTMSKVGAGSVVLRDVPAHCTVAGVPARVVRTRIDRPVGLAA
jgi:serine O-acetyltransferase